MLHRVGSLAVAWDTVPVARAARDKHGGLRGNRRLDQHVLKLGLPCRVPASPLASVSLVGFHGRRIIRATRYAQHAPYNQRAPPSIASDRRCAFRPNSASLSSCASVYARMRACMRIWVGACERASVRVCVCVCVCASMCTRARARVFVCALHDLPYPPLPPSTRPCLPPLPSLAGALPSLPSDLSVPQSLSALSCPRSC